MNFNKPKSKPQPQNDPNIPIFMPESAQLPPLRKVTDSFMSIALKANGKQAEDDYGSLQKYIEIEGEPDDSECSLVEVSIPVPPSSVFHRDSTPGEGFASAQHVAKQTKQHKERTKWNNLPKPVEQP